MVSNSVALFVTVEKQMKQTIALLLIALLPTLIFGQSKPVVSSKSLVFNHVTVIDMTGAPPMADMTVVIAGNRIADVGKAGKIRVRKTHK
jgi:hypothetical protein